MGRQALMKILIVDDSESVRRTIRAFVSDLAEDLCEAADGVEAIAACRDRRPDWVLMDIQMGDMNGITATRHLKAAFPETRVMIVTSFDDPHLREAATQAGERLCYQRRSIRSATDSGGVTNTR